MRHITVLDAPDMERILRRMANEILETHKQVDNLALVGIHTRGVFLARRLCRLISRIESADVPTGAIDINLYRDDWTRISHQPEVRSTDIGFDIDGRQIILVDDVLYTGRTIRAAMDAIVDFGRPARIELCVLIDRGHRELPIQSDYTGKSIETQHKDSVNVLVTEYDNKDRVDLLSPAT
ncbi:MAG: bifunctional pyr operon transcriptional regulator/uracil phosphoribosyltransferase PyrR [Thermodesulfobacteriota bacterium]